MKSTKKKEEIELQLIERLISTIERKSYDFDYCFVGDSGYSLINIYYNPDSNCGGQIVKDVYDLDTVIEYFIKKGMKIEDLDLSEISGEAVEYCYDFYKDDKETIADNLDSSQLFMVVSDYESAESLQEIMKKEIIKYYLRKMKKNADYDLTAEILAESLMDDSVSTYQKLEKFADLYEDGGYTDGFVDRDAYRAGMRTTFEMLLGIKIEELAKTCCDKYEEKKEKEREDEERDL